MAFGDLKGTITGNGASITASNSIAGSVSVAVNDLIWVTFAQQTNLTASGATDNLGNSYTAQNAGTDAGSSTGRSFYSIATVAGTLTSVAIAATASANDYAGFGAVIEGPFSAIDANPANVQDTTSPFTCPATGTLAQADEVIMAWITSPQGTAQTYAATSPNLLAGQADNSTNIKACVGYQTVASTSSVSPAFTAGGDPLNDTVGTASFKKLIAAAGMAWFEPSPVAQPQRNVRVDSPGAFGLTAPAIASTIAGMAWLVSRDERQPERAQRRYEIAGFAFTPSLHPAPVSGMAWFTPPEVYRNARWFGSIPVALAVLQPPAPSVAWFSRPDDPQRHRLGNDIAPALGLPPAAPATITGMGWFEPADIVKLRPASWLEALGALGLLPPAPPSTAIDPDYFIEPEAPVRLFEPEFVRTITPLQPIRTIEPRN